MQGTGNKWMGEASLMKAFIGAIDKEKCIGVKMYYCPQGCTKHFYQLLFNVKTIQIQILDSLFPGSIIYHLLCSSPEEDQ